ncbi:conserved hypothetical protein [Sulfurovum sp. enrichment culture clone C5]|uniref:Endonuclease GajA/Old nuclease/RecF-like AAA domain-containing protein n=1 Tax=Sulfurovum sp. enrichment culture clone C5 TaxID=497650 RepID=A0A0S4XMM8_9BACT|nr:conserved hypothetical protein [Sulfurovum sp. enrichment culture clone C5]
MELVYLWVEKYKNIENQGFNFSPRFECTFHDEYNDDGTLKDDCVLDIKPKKYTSIFPDNINITAIVGENGSGKSNILETLLKLIENELEKKYILVFQYTNKILKYISNIEKIETELQIGSFYALYGKIYIYNKNIHKHCAFRNYNIFEIDKTAIANLLTVHYGISTIPFRLSTFMYLPNQIEIKLTEPSELLERSINYFSPKNREEVKKIFLSIEDKYYQFLIICYGKKNGTGSYMYILKDIEKLKEALADYISQEDYNKYFLQLTTPTSFFISDLTEKEKSIYMKNDGFIHFFDFDFIDEKIRRFDNLSHGEQMIFGQLLNIYAFSHSKKDFIFLLDEPEIALHPNWQKNYLNEVISLCKQMGKKFHFLVTSHSPFLLSDLSKENVIFLKDGKQVYPLNDSEQTFGANIHTLLSHGFFMKDGLMGEFAKSKINKIIEFHKQVEEENKKETKDFTDLKAQYENQKTQFWHIQNIIGEEYLKQVIKNHLIEIEKILLGKDEAKNAEIGRVKAYLESLEND